mgnify:CR=1 FL=1
MIVRMVVAGNGCDGPDLYFCKVECDQEQYDEGEHYDRAKEAAQEYGLEAPLVAFDENDPPKPLFGLFQWKSATTYSVR